MKFVLQPFSMQCSIPSPYMIAAGPAANLAVGLVLWGILRWFKGVLLHARYFLWLTMTFSLFNVAGYFGVGVLTGFGDWAVLLPRLDTAAKVGLALAAATLYYGFMCAAASAGREFLATSPAAIARVRRVVATSYVAAGTVACCAALLSPLHDVILAAAASFGAGWGLLGILDWGKSRATENEWGCIAASAG